LSEGKRALRRPRHRWEDNTRMDHRENRVERRRLDSTASQYGPVAESLELSNEPSGSLKGGELLDQLSDH